ncbi:MAG: type II secretion system protein [Smithella sp.]|jgi:Tfp pilus assembly protein PilX
MLSADKKVFFHRRKNSGFSLVAVIMAILILMALGFLALSVTTTDLQITNRIVGEKKAMTAAEAGIHVLTNTFSPANITEISGSVDATNDPASTYHISVATRPTGANVPSFLPMKGYSIAGGQEWGQKMYETSVTGENTSYGSNVQIDVGFGYFDGGGIMYR